MTSIIDKIRKILRLGNDHGATAEEACAALAKAQQLAAEYGISLTEIPDESDTASGLTHGSVPSLAGLPQKLAAHLVKRHFGVATLFDPLGARPLIHIIGAPVQIELATYVYVYLVRVIRQAWPRRHNKRLRDREAFLRGFAQAISKKLPQVFPQDGLVLSSDAYIADVLIGPGARLVTTAAGSKKPMSDRAFHHGFMAGSETSIHNAITPPPTQLALGF